MKKEGYRNGSGQACVERAMPGFHDTTSAKSRSPGVSIAALFLTLAMFALLPSLELVSSGRPEMIKLRTVDNIVAPPPPPPLAPPEPAVREKPKKMLKPRLDTTRQRMIPVNAILDLDLGLDGVAGDFGLGFDIAAGTGIDNAPDVFELGDLDVAPRPVVQLAPVYPSRARARRVEGHVILEFVIGFDGRTSDIEVVSSIPEGFFEGAARSAVERWRFKPGIRNGSPVAVRVRQKVSFKLED